MKAKAYIQLAGAAAFWFFIPLLSNGQITVKDTTDEGMATWAIQLNDATFYYQKEAAGFSSIIDKDGNDWVGYRPGGGSAGEYRGVPNLGPCCHPGYSGNGGNQGSVSNMTKNTPTHVVIESTSNDGQFSLLWDFYPTHIDLTVKEHGENYWFLYEGTPGGKFDDNDDFFVIVSGRKYIAGNSSINEDISPEWAYFGDNKMNRVLYFVHHTDDNIGDQYWPMNSDMTVFGFGRTCEGVCLGLKETPKKFTIGFSEGDTTYNHLKEIIEGHLAGRRAAFTASENAPCLGSPVQFTNSSTGITQNATYNWSFGEGADPATATGAGSHNVVYNSAGSKNVSLIVDDSIGTDTIEQALEVKLPVTASVTGDFTLCGATNQTFVNMGDNWKYFKGTAEASNPTSEWRQLSFDDAGWNESPSPFWYGDGTGGTRLDDMQNDYTTLFLRKKFNVIKASEVNSANLEIDYDDGFTIWINGNEVQKANAPDNPSFDDVATANHESGTPENFTLSNISQYLNEGENVIAVMGFNATSNSSDFHLNLSLNYEPDDGKTATLTASGGNTYTWSSSQTTDEINVSPSVTTTYTVTVSNGNCKDIESVVVSVNEDLKPVISQTGNTLEVQGISENSIFQWYKDGNIINGANTKTYSPTENGNYTVEVEDPQDCTGKSDAYNFTFTGLEHFHNGQLKIFPNPGNGQYILKSFSNTNEKINIEIFNSKGGIVYSAKLDSFEKGSEAKIDITKQAPGIYILRVVSQSDQSLIKLYKY